MRTTILRERVEIYAFWYVIKQSEMIFYFPSDQD